MSEQIGTLERAASIAAESLKKIEAPVKAKAEAESKIAADETAKKEQAEKDKGIKLAAEQEAKTKEDARIISEDETKLSEDDKKRKSELLEIKKKEDATPDAKIKRVQEQSQKRIDEIKNELLSEREHTKQEMAALKAELEELKKPKQQEDALTKSKREESERIAKYVEEDKSKPKEDRREMSKEELEGWYLEDPLSATEWIQERTVRRSEERKKAQENDNKPDTDKAKKLAEEFVTKQIESRSKLLAKYPGITPSKELIIEAKKEAGVPLDRNLTNEELDKVNSKLEEKSELFKLCREITFSDPKKYIESVNGPELVMAEMEKRLSGKSGSKNSKIELTQEELDAKIEEELERRRLVDGEGIHSTNGGKKLDDKQKNKTELEKKQLDIAKRAKISPEQLEKVVSRRSTIPGAGSFGKDED